MNVLEQAVIGLEEREIENVAKSWLDSQIKAKEIALSPAQEGALVTAAPILINMVVEMALAKATAAAGGKTG